MIGVARAHMGSIIWDNSLKIVSDGCPLFVGLPGTKTSATTMVGRGREFVGCKHIIQRSSLLIALGVVVVGLWVLFESIYNWHDPLSKEMFMLIEMI